LPEKDLQDLLAFLVSSAGYGEFHAGGGTYRFDFTAGDKYRVQGPEIDYYFYFGPTPKEIFEEHNLVHTQAVPWMVVNERFGTPASAIALLAAWSALLAASGTFEQLLSCRTTTRRMS
jgi:hypothetical protein